MIHCHSPTPKKSGHVKMEMKDPAQGTSMGSMHARKTSSSVNGATTWFLNQRMSLRQSVQKHGSLRKLHSIYYQTKSVAIMLVIEL